MYSTRKIIYKCDKCGREEEGSSSLLPMRWGLIARHELGWGLVSISSNSTMYYADSFASREVELLKADCTRPQVLCADCFDNILED